MATFPTLTPSSRTFTPGRHPHSEIPTLNGLQTRVRTSNVILEQQLRLTFVGLTEAEMLSIRSHYTGQQGRFLSFDIPSSLLSGMTTPANFTSTGYSWIYGSAPQVEDIPCAQRYNVSIELVTVPPEGANVNGVEFTVSISLAVGIAAVSTNNAGADLTVTASIEGGVVADNASAGFDITVPVSFVAGVADPGAVSDPNFSSVSLLLHMNGVNNATTFTDSSLNTLAIGNPSSLVSVDTAQNKFGGASARFDGAESLNAPDGTTSAVFALGTGDFTAECWFRITSHSSAIRFLMVFFDGSATFSIILNTSNLIVMRTSSTDRLTGSSPAVDTWHHVAIARESSVCRLFLNGVQQGGTYTTALSTANARVNIGQNSSGSQRFTGWLDDLRITKGVARYTTTFTPPTAAFPDS